MRLLAALDLETRRAVLRPDLRLHVELVREVGSRHPELLEQVRGDPDHAVPSARDDHLARDDRQLALREALLDAVEEQARAVRDRVEARERVGLEEVRVVGLDCARIERIKKMRNSTRKKTE